MGCYFFIFRLSRNISTTFLFVARGTSSTDMTALTENTSTSAATNVRTSPTMCEDLASNALLRFEDLRSKPPFLVEYYHQPCSSISRSQLPTASARSNRSQLMIAFLM